jgi:multidrug efflux pump
MSVSSPFINRPIATSLLGFAVLLGGMLGYFWLPISALPQVDFPTIQITTQLPGANPETMTQLVTAPLERQLGQIPYVTTMVSSSAFGLSQITLQFDLNRDIDGAAQDVQSAINAAASTLPSNLPYPPVYSKVNPADAAVMTVALTSTSYSIRQLSDDADSLIGQRLAQLSGVGHVSIQGGLRPAIRIQADLTRLTNYGISMEDLRAAIVNANVAGAKGSLDGAQQSYTIAANDQLLAADAYKSVVITYRNSAPVFIRDVADVIDGLENTHVAGWYQGRPAVIIDIQRQPGANVVATVNSITTELTRLKKLLPAGVELSIVHDRTGTIRASIRDVQFTLILSIGLVVMVVLLFLRSIRATIIAGVALPLSLVATFGVMYFCGFSLDNLSLMALTIGTGFVVDDAIVMIENIVRHIEAGEEPLEAALNGAREIGFTVISLTVSLIAVFIPLLFMTGIVGRMFREFAVTLTIAVVASAVVSLTLTAMMCGRLLRPEKHDHPAKSSLFTRGLDRVIEVYRRTLIWALDHQGLMLLLTAATLAATFLLYIVIPKGFLPPQDTGLITAVTDAAPTVSFAEMGRLQQDIADRIRADPDVTGVTSVVGVGTINATPNAGRLSIVLKDRDSGRPSVTAIIARLQDKVANDPRMSVSFQSVQDIQITTQASRAQYQYTLTGTDTAEVSTWANKLATALQNVPSLRDVASEAEDSGLRLFVNIDRERAGRLGVSVQNVNDTLYDAFGQRQVSIIYGQSNQYRVILEAQARYLTDPSSLKNLYVTSNLSTPLGGTLLAGGTTTTTSTGSTSSSSQVPISTFAQLQQKTAPLAIGHLEQFPAVTISFNLAPDASLSDAVSAIEKVQKDIGMPTTVTGSYSGDAAEFARSLAGEPWLILAAAVTIYIVLGVLYESAIHPITIMSTLPSAGVGALLALMLFRMDLSLIALIGIVLLMGIVKKNAIMMIDFALEAERVEGLAPHEAILQASLLRFRPIMMTTLAALFGALPLALESGTGSELRNPLGISIVGGLLLSQLITLYTTPVIYLTMENLRSRFFGKPPQPEPVPDEPELPLEDFQRPHPKAAE